MLPRQPLMNVTTHNRVFFDLLEWAHSRNCWHHTLIRHIMKLMDANILKGLILFRVTLDHRVLKYHQS